MFAIVDCDNCFVSCERVFQPDLKGKPVVVLSNNDGCVVARSNEAKALGIKMGVPLFKIQDVIKSHQVEVRSSNYILYADMSNRVMSILREPSAMVDAVEQYSIDEAFLTLDAAAFVKQSQASAEAGYENDGLAWAHALVAKIGQWTGMPVSIGIASTRTLAKTATWFAKHYAGYGKVCVIDNEEKRQKALQAFDIGEVWGVGWRTTDRYRYYGIQTAWDFTQRSQAWVQHQFHVPGVRTWKELQGISCIDTLETGSKKSICTSRSFDGMVEDQGQMEMYISNYAAHCAQKLRMQRSVCTLVTCYAQTNHFRPELAQMDGGMTVSLVTPASSTHEIVAAALRAFRCFYQPGYKFKRAGVIVSGISSAQAIQQDLFDVLTPEQRQKLNKLSEVMDTINRQHGNDTIQLGVQQFPKDPTTGKSTNFKNMLRHEFRSKCYTTSFDDIIQVQ